MCAGVRVALPWLEFLVGCFANRACAGTSLWSVLFNFLHVLTVVCLCSSGGEVL